MELKITRLNKVATDNSLRAYVDIEYYGLQVLGCRIVEGSRGLFVSMPREKSKDGKFYDICRFNDITIKKEFEDRILDEYKKI